MPEKNHRETHHQQPQGIPSTTSVNFNHKAKAEELSGSLGPLQSLGALKNQMAANWKVSFRKFFPPNGHEKS